MGYSILRQNEVVALYFIGYGLLAFFLSMYAYLRFIQRTETSLIYRFTDALALFARLYLLDFFLSTAHFSPSMNLCGYLWFLLLFVFLDKGYKTQLISYANSYLSNCSTMCLWHCLLSHYPPQC